MLGQIAEFSANFLRAMRVDVSELFSLQENEELYKNYQKAKTESRTANPPDKRSMEQVTLAGIGFYINKDKR